MVQPLFETVATAHSLSLTLLQLTFTNYGVAEKDTRLSSSNTENMGEIQEISSGHNVVSED